MNDMRLFVAINLPDAVKERIISLIRLVGPVLPSENWHITLTFLGYQPDSAAPAIEEAARETSGYFDPFEIRLTDLTYAPPDRPARMLWFNGDRETSEKLGLVKKRLDESLKEKGVRFKEELRPFAAHLTLARFPTPIRPVSPIGPISPIIFTADSLDLMESILLRTGAEYHLVSRFPLHFI